MKEFRGEGCTLRFWIFDLLSRVCLFSKNKKICTLFFLSFFFEDGLKNACTLNNKDKIIFRG